MNLLSKLRTYLIKNQSISICKEVISFLNDPSEDILKSLLNIPIIMSFDQDIRRCLESCLVLFISDPSEYRIKYIYAQNIIWQEVVNHADYVITNTVKIKQQRVVFYGNDYIRAIEQLKRLCNIYAETQAKISELEDILGIDRYLDQIGYADITVLNELANEQENILNAMTNEYRKKYQTDWNLAQIKTVLFHKLARPNLNNQICSLLSSGQDKVIIFIVDGFGFCQYLWNKQLWRTDSSHTYKENIFSWLSKQNCMVELILGSGHISDTVAGLGELFSGYDCAETGIIASKLAKNGYLFETKKVNISSFNNTFNVSKRPISSILTDCGYEVSLLYCSRYDENEHGFSNYLYDGMEIMSVNPYERVYSLLLNRINDKCNVQFVYITNIDNSGHTMGAFSKFERQEHQKMNALFRNFLIELAMEQPVLFNGKTSILFTADHGMAESAKNMLNRYDINMRLEDIGISNAILIENNRSLFIYGIYPNEINRSCKELLCYFQEKEVDVDIIYKGSVEFNKMFGTCGQADSICPDIVIRLVGNGLFYSNRRINKHLLHYGGHGGCSANESFVPLLDITLNEKLLEKINERFLERM